MDPVSGVGIPLALAAGLASFLSPCVLPLVPGYLSTVAGFAPGETQSRGDRLRILGPSLLFVLGFSTIFVMLGLGATAIGATLQSHRAALEKVAAGSIVGMGVFFLAAPFVLKLNREFRVGWLMRRAGHGGPVVVGAAFAIAWTPCNGPTLGAILGAASLSNSAPKGALLLAVYSAGLAIPFLATSIAFGQMTKVFRVVRRHYGVVIGIGGAVLIAMGALIWTGEFFRLNIEAQRLLNNLGLDVWNSV